MKHAIVDAHGYATTFGEFDFVKPGMVPVPDSIAEKMLRFKVRYSGGVWTVTDKPILPPQQFMSWNGQMGEWVDARTADQKWAAVRIERDKKLAASDWTTLADVPLSSEARAQWVLYRQALRDVTSQPDPGSINWPTPPSN